MRDLRQQKVHLDILRVIAILGVMFTHSGSYGVYRFLETNNSINFWFGLVLATLTQLCVPLFFMISGALLLRKKETLAYVYKHRVLRMFLVIAILAFILFLNHYFLNKESGFVLSRWPQWMYEGALRTQDWYLYEYFAFLLVLPFLQRMVKAIPEKSWYIYLYFLYLTLNLICPIFSREMGWQSVNANLSLKMFSGCIFYSVMGYFIENASEDIFYKGKNVFLLFVLTAILFAENMRLNCSNLTIGGVAGNSGIYAPYYAIFLFVLVRYLCYVIRIPNVMYKVFAFASSGVFGTYLFGPLLQETFKPIYVVLNTRIKSYPATFVWLLVCLVVGVTISNLLKKIPGIGKLL